MKLRTFVFALPPYDAKSNGVHLYYMVAEMFSALGHRVLAASLNNLKAHKGLFAADVLSSPFQFVESVEVEPDWIPVFPDTSLPHFTEQFETKCRVWYLLNKPYALTGEGCKYRPSDLVLCYSKFISNRYPSFFFNRNNAKLRQFISSNVKERPKKNQIIFYIGKCVSTNIPESVKKLSTKLKANIVVVNRAVPANQRLLWNLIASSRLLVSTDPVTNLNYESTLLGTPCFVSNNYTRTDYSNYEIPLTGIFDDETLLEHAYVNGIESQVHDHILRTYGESISNYSETCECMLARIDSHITWLEREAQNSMATQLDELNQLRIENDRLRHDLNRQKSPLEPDLAVGFSLKPFLSRFSRLKFAALRAQAFLILIMLRMTTNAQTASECFHKIESFRRRAQDNAATLEVLKRSRRE